MPGDLHTHSTFSDGSLRAGALPHLAARTGLSHLAISDHDSLKAVRYAYEHRRAEGVALVPATELTAFDFARGRRVHLLCYWPDPESAALEVHCGLMAARRNAACMQSARELEAIYPQFKAQDALELAQDGGVLFKAAIMQVLCNYGLADGIYRETYKKLFGAGRGRVLHEPQHQPVSEVLKVIRAARGVAVLAHPSVYKSMELARELIAEGRIDGVEIDHPRNTEEDRAELRALARAHGLLVTGGSDFHGLNAGTPRPLGLCHTSDEEIARLEALARKRKQS